ncbi:MAG TPA: ribonuclease D [Gemmatimonadales bacterium]|nr:ribonuclease D [Gemmatimonadales bacterium]
MYLEDQEAVDRFLAGLVDVPLVAVDTEAASFHRYRDRIYLIQLSTRDLTAIVDPLAVTALGGLGRVLADPAVETVFHDADYDLRILNRDYGFHAARVFDTRIAAQLLNEPGIGLAALLAKYLGVTLDKKYQRADWSMRPLLPGMLEYAADDTRYLPRLRDILRERLQAMGRWTWAEEEFGLLEQVRWTPAGPADEAYLRLKGARTLRGRQLAVLRELFQWREATASQLDRAPFRVLQNEALLGIAKAMPADAEALRGLKLLSPDQLRRRGGDLLAAVARGLQAPAESLPTFERGRRPPPDPAYDARLDRLKQVRNALAEEIGLAPGVLCPNGTLEAVARLQPASVEQLVDVTDMRRWQRAVIGPALVEALSKAAGG